MTVHLSAEDLVEVSRKIGLWCGQLPRAPEPLTHTCRAAVRMQSQVLGVLPRGCGDHSKRTNQSCRSGPWTCPMRAAHADQASHGCFACDSWDTGALKAWL